MPAEGAGGSASEPALRAEKNPINSVIAPTNKNAVKNVICYKISCEGEKGKKYKQRTGSEAEPPAPSAVRGRHKNAVAERRKTATANKTWRRSWKNVLRFPSLDP